MEAVRAHEAHVAGQVLAAELVYDAIDPGADGATEVTVEGATLRFSLAVA